MLTESNLFQIFILFQHGAFIADVPIVAAVAAEGLGLRADQARMHQLGQEVIRLAEIRQELCVPVFSGVLRDGAADEMEAKALGCI